MAFTENMQHGCVYMTSDKISAKHMFTTRIGGASKGVFASWNLGVNRGDDDAAVCENYRLAGEIMGCGKDDFVVTKQVHGRLVHLACETDRYPVGSDKRIECDGFVTDVKNLPIMIYIADCVPVLLHDPEAEVIAAVHCGWKSSVQDILGAAVEKCARSEQILKIFMRPSARASANAALSAMTMFPRLWSAISAARRTDFSRISQTAKRMSICAAQMHADLSSSALSARISTCPPSARCVFRRNTGRTVQPTEFAAAWQRRSCSEV